MTWTRVLRRKTEGCSPYVSGWHDPARRRWGAGMVRSSESGQSRDASGEDVYSAEDLVAAMDGAARKLLDRRGEVKLIAQQIVA